jgi:hypothetical protein
MNDIPDEGEIIKISPDRPVELVPEGQVMPVSADAKLNLLCPHCKRTGEGQLAFGGPEWAEAHISGVLPIAPGSKYVILIPDDTETELIFQLQDILGDWWADDDKPFMIISDRFEFVRVDDDTKIPALASCGYHKCPGHTPGDPGGMCDEMDPEDRG